MMLHIYLKNNYKRKKHQAKDIANVLQIPYYLHILVNILLILQWTYGHSSEIW